MKSWYLIGCLFFTGCPKDTDEKMPRSFNPFRPGGDIQIDLKMSGK